MQTRRKTFTLAASTPRPGITSIFRQIKPRALVIKAGLRSQSQVVDTQLFGTKVSALTIQNDTTVNSLVTKKTNRPRKLKALSPMETTPTETVAVSSMGTTATAPVVKQAKLKAPENPWTRRPMQVPPYAKEALDFLCKMDPALTPLIARHPYMIYADHDTNYFRVLTRTILGQQIHWKAARSIIYKFVSYYYPDQVTIETLDLGDKSFPTPGQVLSTPMEKLRLCGLSERKASYVQDLAKHFIEGKITFTDEAMLQSMTDKEVAAQLLCVRGIGPWTVDMFMMNSLERLDVLPTLDLGIRKGMEKHFASEYKNGMWGEVTGMDENGIIVKKGAKAKGKASKREMNCKDMERMAERWRPYRSIASWFMWRNADENTASLQSTSDNCGTIQLKN
ncbi:hypothetical protein BGZ65_004413 [Modicella reniformis]|uniref:HhH-GPD domain-containing protein n=1 Tax=Modicella reniformis TaxID=1440133 RepID=A0A9P6M8X5_9FUNG|nr:hypothetical protein BGZ65_004413 [Modicella reniformis]